MSRRSRALIALLLTLGLAVLFLPSVVTAGPPAPGGQLYSLKCL